MAKVSDQKAGALDEDKAGLLTGLFAEENEFDRRALWRIGTWGVAAVGAVVLAVTSNQWSLGLKREQLAAADLSRQAQQIQSLTRDSQNETRRLANAVETLNSDRDRLFSRITVLEQGLDSVTGTVAKQAAAANVNAVPKPPPSVAPPPTTMMPPTAATADQTPPSANAAPSQSNQAAIPQTAPVTAAAATPPAPDKPRADAAKPDAAPALAPAPPASLPQIAAIKPAVPLPATPLAQPQTAPSAQSLGSAKSMMGPPDPAAPKLVEPAKTATTAPAPAAEAGVAASIAKEIRKDQEKAPSAAEESGTTTPTAIQRTEFAVELGGANSISGLRALWRGLLKSNSAELAELRPIIVLREGNTGLGMQLRLAAGPLPNAADAARICAALTEMQRACDTTVFDGQRLAMTADEQPSPSAKPAAKPSSYRRYAPKHSKKDETPPPKETSTSTFSSLFGSSKR